HLSEHFELSEKIAKIERRAAQFSLEALRVFDLDCFGCFFDEPDDVAHSENSAREALRHELLELIEPFAGADEFDRAFRDFAHRQRRAAACVAVEFRQNNSSDLQRVIEMRCNADRLLAGGSIDDEQGFLRPQKSFELLKLFNQGEINFLATRGVEDGLPRRSLGGGGSMYPFDRCARRALDTLFARIHRENRNVDLFSERCELLDGCRSLQIQGNQRRRASLFL